LVAPPVNEIPIIVQADPIKSFTPNPIEVQKEEVKVVVPPVKEEKEVIFNTEIPVSEIVTIAEPIKHFTNNVMQNSETQTIAYTFNQPIESLPKKDSYYVRNDESDDFSEDSFNYMI
jgi:hypothetical protein